ETDGQSNPIKGVMPITTAVGVRHGFEFPEGGGRVRPSLVDKPAHKKARVYPGKYVDNDHTQEAQLEQAACLYLERFGNDAEHRRSRQIEPKVKLDVVVHEFHLLEGIHGALHPIEPDRGRWQHTLTHYDNNTTLER